MPHGEEAHEVMEDWEDEFGWWIFGSTLTIPSWLQQEKDGDLEMQELLDHSARKPRNKRSPSAFISKVRGRRDQLLEFSITKYLYITLNILISLLIFTLLYSDSLSFSDDVAKTTRIGRIRRSMCRSGNRSAKSSSSDSTAKTMRTWRISSTLNRVKELKRE